MTIKFKYITFKQTGDERGSMTVIQGGDDVDFEIRRLFYIYATKGNVVRGKHANRNSKFMIACVAGSCKVLVDDGYIRKEYTLEKPFEGLYLDKMVWKDMYDFSEDSVLLVLSSEKYDPDEYIREYDQWKKEVTGGN